MLAATTLRRRIHALALILAAGFVIVGVLGPLTIRERDAAASDLRSRIEPMRRALGTLQLAVIDQESAVRGFVLTSDEAALAPYYEGLRSARAQLSRLGALSARDPGVAAEVVEVRTAVERWQSEVAEHEIALVREQRVGEAVAFERSGRGRQLFAELRAQLLDLRQAMLREAVAADERVVDARWRLTALVWALVLAGLVLAVASGVLLRRWVTLPLRRIGAAVAAVTRGDRHHRIPAVGPPELATLGAGVEGMRAEMVRRLDEAVRAREALEQQGPAVVTLRAELAPRHGLLPQCLTFAAAFEPAEGDLAGDWYDLVDLGGGRVALLMVDVSGHGPQAGVFALRAKHLLNAVMADRPAPGEALNWLAARIGETGERFLTSLVVEIDPRRGLLRYANAGHPPALVLTPDGALLGRLEPTGPLLGPLPGRWVTAQLRVPAGSRVVAFTDGLLEARDRAGHDFGDDRLRELLHSGIKDPADIPVACVERVRAFSGGRVGDDVTVAAMALEPARHGDSACR